MKGAEKDTIMATTGHSTAVPQTLTPWGKVVICNTLSLVALWAILGFMLGLFTEEAPMMWALFATTAMLGILISGGYIAVTIPDWHAITLFDPVFKTRRVIFQGLQWKVWWEKLRKEGLIDLKRELHADETPLSVATNDPAERMEVTRKIHLQINTTGDPTQDAKNVIHYDSYDDDAIIGLVTGDVDRMIQQHYSEHELEELSHATAIQEAVFKDDTTNCDCIRDLGHKFGMHIGVIVAKSVPDKDTQDMKRTPARAEGLRTAMDKLTAAGSSQLTPELARRAALNLDPNADFTEAHTDWDVTLNAAGLENLEHVSLIPPGILGGQTVAPKKGERK